MVQRKVKFSWIKVFLPITLLFLAINSPLVVLAHSQTQVIEMTTNGFVPQEVTIDESSTIIFINKDSVAHWPASDIHPTHEIYPEFDPKKGIEQGKSWTFKFTRVGEWGLHDHLFPHFRGKITVLKESGNTKITSSAPNFWDMIKDLFKKITNKFKVKKTVDISNISNLPQDAQIKVVKDMADQEGAEKVWQKLKELFKGQAGSSGNIHDLAHLTGGLLYEGMGFKGLGNCSGEFAFGCYHGFLDKAFAQSIDKLQDADDACMKLDSTLSGPVASCIHGIGHGIASFYSTTDIKKALSSCRKLTSGSEYCFDGVFMEFVRSAPPSFFKQEDTLYPCDSLEKEFGYSYSFACGRNQPALLMSRFNLGFDEVVNVCLNSKSQPFKQACFDSLGFSLTSTGDVEKIVAGCQKIGDPEFINRCIKAAAGELVFQEVPGWFEKSQFVCNTSSSKDECLQNVDRIIKEYKKQVKINFSPKSSQQDLNSYIRNQMMSCYKQVAQIFYDQFGLSQTLQTYRFVGEAQRMVEFCSQVDDQNKETCFKQMGMGLLDWDKNKDIAKKECSKITDSQSTSWCLSVI